MRKFLHQFRLRRSISRGETIEAFGRQMTPLGRVTQVRLPGGALTWHAPLAVEVRDGEGSYRLPIQNVTRRMVAGIVLGGCAIMTFASWWKRTRHVRERREQS